MNLYTLLQKRAGAGRPVRAGLIGAGKFGAMFLAPARTIEGLHVMAVADLQVERAQRPARRPAGTRRSWPPAPSPRPARPAPRT